LKASQNSQSPKSVCFPLHPIPGLCPEPTRGLLTLDQIFSPSIILKSPPIKICSVNTGTTRQREFRTLKQIVEQLDKKRKYRKGKQYIQNQNPHRHDKIPASKTDLLLVLTPCLSVFQIYHGMDILYILI
jgi:hypothetical protein